MLETGLILRALARNKIGALLIALQIALTMAIMVNAIFMIQDRQQQMQRESGIDEANTFYLTNTIFGQNYNIQAHLQTDLHMIRNTPGVIDAVQINAVPLSSSGWSMALQHESGEDKDAVGSAIYMVDDHGINALGLTLIAGNNFKQGDVEIRKDGQSTWPAKTIITQAFAENLYPDNWQSAIGKTVYISQTQPMQIIGIVKTLQAPWNGWDGVERSMLVPFQRESKGSYYFIRTEAGRRDELMPIIEKALAQSDKERIIRRVTTTEDTRNRSYQQHNATNKILTTVVVTLTLITGFGIVGLAIFSINRRTKQIGTRRALGATKGQIMRYFMMENFIISTFGNIIGCIGAIGLNMWLVNTFNLSPIGIELIAFGVIALFIVGQIAVLYPARKAALIAPATATRTI
ncbi:MAG: FtsX-like permease family protein [Colwellia polaris]|jgi:putative ABC transport system permease protein|uniref:ABC transporter permease n=1 Tax=Colwellia polaris TaxID=326537 RepID=UPI000A177A8B|nr:FtsX-like permease family protein [Colwellia polaris]|tara:strand:+ start:15043 stop:16257 length:1215 start_codon:yes stop_codon:yes gene_type:complete